MKTSMMEFCSQAATRDILYRVVDFSLQLYDIKRLWHRCFPMNFAKFLRTPFLQISSGRLLLLGLQIANSQIKGAPLHMLLYNFSKP